MSFDAQKPFEILPLILKPREEPSKFSVVFEYYLALSQFLAALIFLSLSTSELMRVQLVDDEKCINFNFITAVSIKVILPRDHVRILSIVHLQLAVALEDGLHEELEDGHLLLCRHVGDFKFYSD